MVPAACSARLSDAAIAGWVERHDLRFANIREARAAFEDAQSLTEQNDQAQPSAP